MSEFEEFEDLNDDINVINAKDENGNNVEFIILDTAEYNDAIYLLVVESGSFEDDEAEATILKEVKDSADSEYSTYSLIEDEDEFNKVIDLFQNNNDEYSIEL